MALALLGLGCFMRGGRTFPCNMMSEGYTGSLGSALVFNCRDQNWHADCRSKALQGFR